MSTFGDTVIYVSPASGTQYNGHREHPALVTQVWSESCLNLKVLFDCGPMLDATSQLPWDGGENSGWCESHEEYRKIVAEAAEAVDPPSDDLTGEEAESE